MMKATVEENNPTVAFGQFWELDSLGIIDKSAEDHRENEVIQRFETSSTAFNGRYEVGLPWKSSVKLATSEDIAPTKETNQSPDLMRKYNQAIRLYQNNGMAEVYHETGAEDLPRAYYMPHQAVLRDE